MIDFLLVSILVGIFSFPAWTLYVSLGLTMFASLLVSLSMFEKITIDESEGLFSSVSVQDHLKLMDTLSLYGAGIGILFYFWDLQKVYVFFSIDNLHEGTVE